MDYVPLWHDFSLTKFFLAMCVSGLGALKNERVTCLNVVNQLRISDVSKAALRLYAAEAALRLQHHLRWVLNDILPLKNVGVCMFDI